MDFRISKITSVRAASVVRILLALFLAPALPSLLLTYPALVYGDVKYLSSIAEGMMLAGSVLAFPVTWIAFFPLYCLFRRNNITSIFGYVVTGALLGLLISLVFPPVALVAVPFGALIGAGVWCSLHLFRDKEPTCPGSTAD